MSQRMLLPNDCSMSAPSVYPNNWESGGSKLLRKDWRIQYYFYPPQKGKRKLIVVKGMNNLKTLPERKSATKRRIKDLIENNKMGYSPISKKFVRDDDENSKLNPSLNFISAFRIAISKMDCSEKHRKTLSGCVSRLERKVVELKLHNVVIGDLKRRQIRPLLEALDLSNYSYNKHLGYLSRIFGELIEYECCEYNIVRDIRKRKVIKNKGKYYYPKTISW